MTLIDSVLICVTGLLLGLPQVSPLLLSFGPGEDW